MELYQVLAEVGIAILSVTMTSIAISVYLLSNAYHDNNRRWVSWTELYHDYRGYFYFIIFSGLMTILLVAWCIAIVHLGS